MIFDIVVLAVFLISCLVAFLRGLIREVLTIFGLVGGLLAAWYVGPHFAPVMRGWLGAERGDEPRYLFDIVPYTVLADLLAYGSIFLLVVILLSVVSYMLSKSARAIGLGAVDRSMGVMFGMARAVVLLGLLYLLPYMMIEEKERQVLFGDSRARPHVERVSAWMAGFLPDAWQPEDRPDAGNDDPLARVTRQKIEKSIERLQGGATDAPEPAAIADPAPAQPPGYEDDQRRDLQDLIDDNLNE